MSKAFPDPGPKPALIWVDINLIDVDHNYQRDLNELRVGKILGKFSWAKFGAIMLSEKADGRYNCYEGQHRLAAAKIHPDISQVPACVVSLETVAKEAETFLAVNVNRTAVSTIERYWAGITASDAAMLDVTRVLGEAGCTVVAAHGAAKNGTHTHAVTAVHRAIRDYGDAAVTRACKILSTAWPKDKTALHGSLIRAIARVARANSDMSDERMVKVLSDLNRTQLTANAEVIRKMSGGTADVSLARTAVEIYNRGLSKNTIELGAAPKREQA